MESTKKLNLLYARSKNTKNPQYSPVEQQVGIALADCISHLDGENKRIGSFIEVNRVVEIPMGKEKPALLVYFSYKSHKVLLTNLFKKVVA